MPRFLSSVLGVFLYALPVVAQAKPAVVERAVALQRAMAEARDQLKAHRPADAAATLEAQLANAEGNKAFLSLLRDVYTEELPVLVPTSPRVALVRERLILLGGTPTAASVKPDAPKIEPTVERDIAREAATAFLKQQWLEAASLFAEAAKSQMLSDAEQAAWEFCRKQTGEAKTPEVAKAPTPAGEGLVESESFHVRPAGSREQAEVVAKTVEAKRKELFTRWSGPPSGGWTPRCEITLHRDGDAYAKATGRPANGVGHATIRFADGKIAERRLDLRADDANLLTDTLPRELTHIVLADLFPAEPPPLWAEAGIAILDESANEIERYQRTLPRCAKAGELFAVQALLDLKTYPESDRITAFYCQSVSLVEYLVKLRGERNFTIFLRDSKRYGLASALKKSYELDGLPALEREWRQHALAAPRAQAP